MSTRSEISSTELLERLKSDGAEDWQSVVDALEDGEYLERSSIEDQETVEFLHAYAQLMAASGSELN